MNRRLLKLHSKQRKEIWKCWEQNQNKKSYRHAHEEHTLTLYNLAKWNLDSDLCGYSPFGVRCAYTVHILLSWLVFIFWCCSWCYVCITLLLCVCVCFFHFAFPWWFWIFYERNGNESHASRITVQTKCFNIPQLKICNSTTIRSYIPNGHLVYSHFVGFFYGMCACVLPLNRWIF